MVSDSLNDIKNYKDSMNEITCNYLTSYLNILIDYIKYIINHKKMFKSNEYMLFITNQGIKPIKYIFNMLLLYTKNIDLTNINCRKAYIYFVEFIVQIADDTNTYLKLNSKDATIFIYKKTIYELNTDYKKNHKVNKKDRLKIDIIYKYTNILNIFIINYFNRIVNKNDDIDNNYINDVHNMFKRDIKLYFKHIDDKLLYNNYKKLDYIEKFVININKSNIINGNEQLSLYKLFSKRISNTINIKNINILDINDNEKYILKKNKYINEMFSQCI